MNMIIHFIIKVCFFSLAFGVSTTICCTPLLPVANWCEKQQFAAKTPKLYWRWAWAIIFLGVIALVCSLGLSIAFMNLPQVQGVLHTALSWFTHMS